MLVVLTATKAADASDKIEEMVVRPTPSGDGSLVLSSTRAFTPPASFTDLLLSTPAISLVGQGGRLQTFAIRGLGQERIRVMLNDAPLRPLRRAGVSAAFLNPAWFRVLVQPASAPVAQGSGSLGGNVLAAPMEQLPNQVSVTYEGSGNARTVNANFSTGNSLFGLGHQQMDDQSAADGTRLNTSFEQSSLLMQHRAQIASTTSTTTLSFSDGTDVGKSNSDYPERITNYPTDQHIFASQEVASQHFGKLSAWLHKQKLETKTLRDGVRTDVNTEVLDYGMRFTRDMTISDVDEIHWGLDMFGRHDFDVSENDANALRDGTELELGAFLEGIRHINNWSLGYGIRLLHGQMDSEDRSDVDTSRILGHASIGWQSGSSFSWRFKTHRATTLPTVSQLFFTGTTGRGQVIGNAELNAEDGWIYEFSTRSTFAFIDVSLSAFYMDIDSFITKLAITDDIDSFRNADGGEIYGFNGEVAADVANMRIEAGFSTLRGELDNGDAIRDIPANQATLRLRWPLLSGSAAMELAQRFESDRVADDNRKEDARSLINASYQRQLGDRLTVTIFGRNLLDELYYVSGDRKSALGPERTFGITLNARI